MLSAQEARERLRRGDLDPAPLDLAVVEGVSDTAPGHADFLIDLAWQGVRRRFAAAYKAVATPRKLEAALREAKAYAAAYPDTLPMVLLPYISDETAERLQQEQVSGLDFSGNVALIVPGQWLVLRTGRPNRFPSSQAIKHVYEGTSALVGRVLLRRPAYDLVKQVRQEIVRRGGAISLGTVSKVLTALEEDLIVQKQQGIRLLHPARLLDRLVEHYPGPAVKRRRRGKAPLQPSFFDALLAQAARSDIRLAGRSEALYAITPTSAEWTTIYVSRLGDWLDAVPFQATERFANVEFAEAGDPAVFFDLQQRDGFPWCSMLQIYLELMGRDKREREAAFQLREDLLNVSSLQAT